MRSCVVALLIAGCSGPTHALTPRIPSPITQPCGVTGTIVDLEAGDPLAGATVFFGEKAESYAITDEDGKFAIDRKPEHVKLHVYWLSRHIEYPANEVTCRQPVKIQIDSRVDDNGDRVPPGEI